MLPPGLETPRQVKAHYNTVYNDLISSGAFQPFLYPQATLGFAIILIYLLIDHRRRPLLQKVRLPLFGLLVAFSIWNILNVRARSAPAAYGVGLISSWGTMWTAAVMAWNDCQTDFRRLERADEGSLKKVREDGGVGRSANGSVNGKGEKERRVAILELSEKKATQGPANRTGPIFWQAYPEQPFLERLDWAADVFCSFRGVGWGFETSGIPKLPKHIELELEGHEDANGDVQKASKDDEVSPPTTSYTGLIRFSSRQTLLRFFVPRLFLGAATLDIVKTLMHHDPYFWGYTNTTTHPPWLFGINSPVLLRSARLLLSFVGISVALNTIFLLGPLFFVYILSSKRIGLRGAPFLNPPTYFGSISLVLNKGLAGFWSSYWHQTFRYAFQAPATRLLSFLQVEPRSQKGRLIGLWLAFALSGLLHASGSTTQLGDTRPIRGPFAFFLSQALGMTVQTFFAQKVQQHFTSHLPRPLRQFGNLSFVIVWMYFTAPLLVDDFAKGGVWLYEPLIISPLRLLGWGQADDRQEWILWKDLVSWRTGSGWWDTGLAF
ncbi:hypothetical protein CKM354_000918100 [Cercospora kikuchii]|uniref:Wax synthase domain-containing protein n=1 Tax=Cercospora kikuchii TaxID=84275 RepID=A0A9P3CNH5_9PEZI|nr:uncharacterized protein CKM354_000918100 [Cercospora kikuchii]GIZ46039.1 hypothetical protein CKM354_000918100 [Cercospora kikuchii]